MIECFQNLFSSDGFMPHGGCYLWKEQLIWLHVLANGAIALAYFSIPITLIYFIRNKDELSFNWMYGMFAAFILFCGITHVFDIITIWVPLYWTEGWLAAVTGLVSVSTAVLLWPLIPRALKIPSPKELKQKNVQLQKEIERRETAENELQRLNRELERKVEEKTEELEQFIYAASHDLSEPLRHISGFTTILREHLNDEFDSIPKDLDGTMQNILDATESMQNMTDALLRLSRVSKKDVELSSVSLNDVTDSALENLSESLQENNVEVRKDELPTIRASKELLTILYQNLIGNAIKYASDDPDTGLFVHLTAEQREDGWVFGVRDNGIGLDDDQMDVIFQPFQRAHRKKNPCGSGIGLSICKKIVEHHNGTIRVESDPGDGAHFLFTLNAGPSDADPANT